MADSEKGASEGAANGVQAVGDAALNLGVTVARSIAEGLSGQPQPPIAGESRMGVIVRSGTTALGSLVAMTMSAARDAGFGLGTTGGTLDPSTAPEGAAAPAAAGLPRVMPGSSLRVPLSIDNPTDQTMGGLTPHLLGARRGTTHCMAPFALHFEPACLSIGPRDFEKLVVTITLPPDMPEGRWSAIFALDPHAPDPSEIAFLVATPWQASDAD